MKSKLNSLLCVATLIAISFCPLMSRFSCAQSKSKGPNNSKTKPTLQDKTHAIITLGQQIFSPKGARFINIPRTDSSYETLKPQVFYSKQELNDFLELAETKHKWDNFNSFKKSLAGKIDFSRESLLLEVIPAGNNEIVKLGLRGIQNETLFIHVKAITKENDGESRNRARMLAIDSRRVNKVRIDYQFQDVDNVKITKSSTMELRK